MPLKDYTTKKEPEQTIIEISELLKDFGVRGILSEYDDTGNIISMSFRINIDGNDIAFRLPTDWKPVLRYFEEDKKTPRSACTEEQARKTAWRLVFHWIEAQLALVRLEMVKLQTVFLPYAVMSDGRTFGERFDQDAQLLLQ